MAFNPTKPVQTRDGRKARILCTDAKGSFPIIALVTSLDDNLEKVITYSGKGKYRLDEEDFPLDLINQRRPHADLIIAWANGAEIEYYDKHLGLWRWDEAPDWDAHHVQYRIKE